MILDLKLLFAGGEPIKIDYTFTPESGIIDGCSPVKVTGILKSISSVIYMELNASFILTKECDRCLTIFERKYDIPVKHIVVNSVNNEDNDEFILVEDMTLDLDELIMSDIQLTLPMKHLCKEDCRGLCSTCGKNLNTGDCNCTTSRVDPRLEALRSLIE